MHDPSVVQLCQRRGHVRQKLPNRAGPDDPTLGIHVTRAAVHAGRAGQVHIPLWEQRHQQPLLHTLWMTTKHRHGRRQGRVFTRTQAGRQFVLRQPVAGHGALEQLERQFIPGHGTIGTPQPVDVARGTTAQTVTRRQG